MHLRHAFTTGLLVAASAPAGYAAPPSVLAIGSISGAYEDFATRTSAPLENGVPGNRLGGIGSGLAHLGGDWFVALPDRGPNAVPYNACMDDTVSFVDRFQTLHLSLAPADPGAALPFTLTPMLVGTTLLSSRSPLVYGAGCGVAGSGAPALNTRNQYYFTGRSDNFDATAPSGDPRDGRLDPESIRVSNDRRHVYISDEYGPYVDEFDRETGVRTRAFALPAKFYVASPSAMGDAETGGNAAGRVANHGMEGLAITPDGRTLVGAMQSPLIQDGGKSKGGIIRIVTIDVATGATREYAYPTDTKTKTSVSDIVAINDHQFLVDERDGKGRGDGVAEPAVFKKLYIVDLAGAADVSSLEGEANLAPHVLAKTLFLDLVQALTSAPVGLDATQIPAKLEGLAFGPDVTYTDPVTHQAATTHTLFVANDNDFLGTLAPPDGNGANPNQWFVFGFTDADLPGYEAQRFVEGDRGGDRDTHAGRDDGGRGRHR